MASNGMIYSAEFMEWTVDGVTRLPQKRTRHIKLSDATLVDIEKHYKVYTPLKEEFERTRPTVYFTHGTFKEDPLLNDYKYFLKRKGIDYIAIDD